MRPQERASFITHFIGFLFAIAGTAYLLAHSWGDTHKFATLAVYGLAVIFLFASSSLYHAFKKTENDTGFFRKMDHFAIFLMIAGTYTPPTWEYLSGGWRIGILGAQWTLVLFGVFFKFFYLNAPRALSAGVYVAMGWLAVIPIHKFFIAMPLAMFLLFIAGGIAFTAGAVIYARKRPDPLPGTFGFHEIFHLFILAGAGIHFAAMLYLLPA
ncbi:MAG: hemolysin III family protein [Spirochaetes bacterium]|nr:hemolysin III family protein [Spirochaetota bacterium]